MTRLIPGQSSLGLDARIGICLGLLVLSSLVTFVNGNVAGILSGVDQIMLPDRHRMLERLVVGTGLVMKAAALLALMPWRSSLLNLLPAALSAVWLALSVRVLWIDTFDMYFHIEEERVVINAVAVAVFLLLAVARGPDAPHRRTRIGPPSGPAAR